MGKVAKNVTVDFVAISLLRMGQRDERKWMFG